MSRSRFLSAQGAPRADAGSPPSPGGRGRAPRLALAALAACLALLALGAAAAQAATGSIEGKVTNAKEGKALAGIEVTATNEHGVTAPTVTTEAKGEYKITSLAAGTYKVRFFEPTETYVEVTEEEVAVEEGKVTKLNVALREFGSLYGKVTNASGGALGDVDIYVHEDESPFAEEEASSAPDGEYKIEHLPPGRYYVNFSKEDFIEENKMVVIEEGKELELNVALTEGGKIAGTVTSAVSHAGLAKIGVTAFSKTGGFYFALTDSSGEYTITGLATGSYTVEFYWEFSRAEEKEFEHAPRFIPKYITQYYSGQPSEATANPVGATAGTTTSGINAAMVSSAPTNTAGPVASGTPAVGSLLTCSAGSWTGENELTLAVGWPLSSPFAYQWLREGAPIAGASSSAYLVQAADEGHSLSCEVTVTNDAGGASARSNALAVPAPPPNPVVTTSAPSTLVVFKNATKVPISCAGAPCAGTIEVIAVHVVKHRKKTVVLAKASYSLAAGKQATVTLHIRGSGAKLLLAAKHHHTTAKLAISVTGGKRVEKGVGISAAVRK